MKNADLSVLIYREITASSNKILKKRLIFLYDEVRYVTDIFVQNYSTIDAISAYNILKLKTN